MKGISATPLTGSGNTAVGNAALAALQTTAANNTALGYQAGDAGTAITTGSSDTFIGYEAQSSANNLTNATAIGANAVVGASNSLVLGSISPAVNVGIGTTTPGTLLTVAGPISLQEPTTTGCPALNAYTVAATDSSLIFSDASGCTVTLPAVATYPGRILLVSNNAAGAIVSNASNVFPQGSTTAGTAILPATIGAWAILQDNGTDWVIMGSGGGGSTTALNAITAATATHTIDSTSFGSQVWNWSTLATGTALTLADTDATATTATTLAVNNAATGTGYALAATMSGSGNTGAAVYGSNSSNGYGVYGTNNSAPNAAVYGYNNYTGGAASNSNITALSGGSTNFNVGIYGTGSSTNESGTIGVYGLGVAYGPGVEGVGSGSSQGVVGITNGNGIPAIFGQNQGAGNGVGVEGEHVATNNIGYGVYGINNAATNTAVNWGVYGETQTTAAGYGVEGNESGASNSGYGVYGINSGTTNSGTGGYFTNTGGGYALITGTGNVGIGNSAPGALLDVGTQSTTEGLITLENGTGTTSVTIQGKQGAASTSIGTWTLTLPGKAAATDGQFLSGTAAGAASWNSVQGTMSWTAMIFSAGTQISTSALAPAKMTNAGHFTQLVCATTTGATCASICTSPEFNVEDVTGSTTGTATSGLSSSIGTVVTAAQTLTFAAGDEVAIYVSTASTNYTVAAWHCTATYTQP